MVAQVVELSAQLAQLEEVMVNERKERMRIEIERTRVESENAQLLTALTEEQRLHDERIVRLQDELAAAQADRHENLKLRASHAAAEEEVVRLRADQDARASEARSLEAQLAAMAAELQKLEANVAANAACATETKVLAHPACPRCRPLHSLHSHIRALVCRPWRRSLRMRRLRCSSRCRTHANALAHRRMAVQCEANNVATRTPRT